MAENLSHNTLDLDTSMSGGQKLGTVMSLLFWSIVVVGLLAPLEIIRINGKYF